jgi:hypothetical protein
MTSHDDTARTEALAWLADRMAWERTLDQLVAEAEATGAPIDLSDRTVGADAPAAKAA